MAGYKTKESYVDGKRPEKDKRKKEERERGMR